MKLSFKYEKYYTIDLVKLLEILWIILLKLNKNENVKLESIKFWTTTILITLVKWIAK